MHIPVRIQQVLSVLERDLIDEVRSCMTIAYASTVADDEVYALLATQPLLLKRIWDNQELEPRDRQHIVSVCRRIQRRGARPAAQREGLVNLDNDRSDGEAQILDQYGRPLSKST